MPTLGEFVNVYNSALEVLRQKGFRVWKNERADMFVAEKDGWDYMAENPISLLGLVSMGEHISPARYREYWWKLEGPLDYHSLPCNSPEFVSVMPETRGS